jgi:hypothetical protein
MTKLIGAFRNLRVGPKSLVRFNVFHLLMTVEMHCLIKYIYFLMVVLLYLCTLIFICYLNECKLSRQLSLG